MMKELYEEAKLERILFENEDIITDSTVIDPSDPDELPPIPFGF